MRLFVAIEFDQSVIKAVQRVQRRLSRFDPEVRWTGPEQMHLTLKFLGEVPDDQVRAVCGAAKGVADRVAPIHLAVNACGCFPPRGDVRIIHAGIAEPRGLLQRCRHLSEDAFAGLGFERERRPYSPHLTLGRVRRGRRADGLREAVAKTSCDSVDHAVEALWVIRSDLKPGGAQYTKIAEHPLSGPA